ncbi:hypothetical protein GALMADRAFT_247725 [Galerina marginata CBS 339.88]|uniref:Calcium-dependent phosphotriesterase n=1 Tax=Galerina marginata (strain CBS 339.88) TaxID=685588 RepID=A0A067TBF5_GALM3|nr:hypothetical protein GALMADRAFT_247725 [Galerina marginata CBS 339.88]
MPGIKTLTWILVVLNVIWYRSGDLIKNCIFDRSPFTRGYIANGDYASDCKVAIRDAERQEEMSSCEDGSFWELHNAQGKVVERPVIVSCDPGRRGWNTVMGPLRNPDPHGALWLYVPQNRADKGQGKPQILSSKIAANKAHRIVLKNYPANHDFHPLGVEIWPSHAGNSSNVYVINHARERTVVEQFVINPSTPTEAEHVRTISSFHFLSANGLALTSPDAFYVSNDHLLTRRLPIVGHVLPVAESLLALPLGFVSHITLNKHTHAGGDAIAKQTFTKMFIPFPNGVAVSSSGSEVAIVSTSTNQILIYGRDPLTDKLTHKKDTVIVPFSPDNAHYAPSLEGEGEDIIVAGHPNFPDLTKVAASKAGATSASWVVAIVPKPSSRQGANTQFDLEAPVSTSSKLKTDGEGWTLKTLFQSDGVEESGGFSGSTTGLRDPVTGTFYVAGLYDKGGFMVCEPSSKATK